jgi:hypothetical protein
LKEGFFKERKKHTSSTDYLEDPIQIRLGLLRLNNEQALGWAVFSE